MSLINSSDSVGGFIYKTTLFVFILFTTLVYILPADLWISYPSIGQLVEKIADIAPSIRNFMRQSTYPQETSTVYALGIIGWPIIMVAFYMGPQRYYIKKLALSKKYPFFRLALGVCGIILVVYVIYFIIPGESSGSGKYSRGFQEMYVNRIIFSAYSTLFFIVISFYTSGLLLWIKEFLREMLNVE